jgi:hypothetical protein
MSADDDPVVRVFREAVPRRRWRDHVVSVGVIFVGMSLTVPLVLVGGVALGWSAGVAFLYAVVCCLVLYASGVVSRLCDERRTT